MDSKPKTCRHCDVEFRRPHVDGIPDDRCTRCDDEIKALWPEPEPAKSWWTSKTCIECGHATAAKVSDDNPVCPECVAPGPDISGVGPDISDPVNHPAHYQSDNGIECIEVTCALNFCLGNAFKYLYRHRHKGKPLEDLKKAVWYMNREEADRASSEEWREFPSDRRYEASNLGRIRMKGKQPRKLVPIKSGYLTFVVSTPTGSKCFYAHRAVAESFLDFDPGLEVCHLDGVRTNNAVWNLRLGTSKENNSHKHAHGTDYRGERNPSSRLAEHDVAGIRGSRGAGTCASVAADFGVTAMTVRRIWSGAAWSERPAGPVGALAQIFEEEVDPNIAAALELICHAQWYENGAEGVRKARWYVERRLAELEGELEE